MWKRFLILSIALCAASSAGLAQSPLGKLWRISTVAVAAASAADVHSSWGRTELNPLLRSGNGAFGARALALKSGVVAAGLVSQWILLRRHPKAATRAAYGNLAVAGVLAGLAAHNYRLKPGAVILAPRTALSPPSYR